MRGLRSPRQGNGLGRSLAVLVAAIGVLLLSSPPSQLGHAETLVQPRVVGEIVVGAAGYEPVSVDVNPRTGRIYTANLRGNNASVIDATTRKVIATVAVAAEPHAVAVNPVTNRIYVGSGLFSGPGTLTVIDGLSNAAAEVIPLDSAPSAVAVNPDTNRVYVASEELNRLVVLDGRDNSLIDELPVQRAGPLTVDPISNRVYAVSGRVHEEIAVIDGNTDSVTATAALGQFIVAVAVDSALGWIYAVDSYAGNLTVIDASTYEIAATVPLGPNANLGPGRDPALRTPDPTAIAVNPTTHSVYVAISGSARDPETIAVFDGETLGLLAKISAGEFPRGLAINSAMNQVLVIRGDSVLFVDSTRNSVEDPLPLASRPSSIAVDPTANRAYVALSEANAIAVIDGASDSIVADIALEAEPVSIAVDPSSKRVYVAHRDKVVVIDGPTNAVASTIEVGTFLNALAVNSATGRVYAVDAGDDVLYAIDGSTHAVLARVEVGQEPVAVAVDAATNRIYTVNGGAGRLDPHETMSVVDGGTNEIIATVDFPPGTYPRALTVNARASRVYVVGQGRGELYVIDGGTYAVETTIRGLDLPWSLTVQADEDIVYITEQPADSLAVVRRVDNAVAGRIRVGQSPVAVGLNPTSRRIYVANARGDSVSVIDA
jgi:YVTN family beta-propeller protein